MGNLLNASLVNHKNVNGGAVIPGYPGYQALLWTSRANYPKVIKDGREYAMIGDRLYTHHAVDRLQPSGLGAPAGAVDEVVRMVHESGTVRVVTENDIVITVITRGVT